VSNKMMCESVAGCTRLECCLAECTPDMCTGNTHRNAFNDACANAAQCTSDECCDDNPVCQDSDCKTGFHRNAHDAACSSATCSVDECCAVNPTCVAADFVCEPGQSVSTSSAPCDTKGCSVAECCSNNPTCEAGGCNASSQTLHRNAK
jgi:hypothetical protein